MAEGTKKWYVIRAVSGKEKKVKEGDVERKKPDCPNPVWKVSGQKFVCE